MANASTSVFVVFEGIDGTGKTTQVQLLRDALERAGESPVVSREPTNGTWGRLIKESAATGRLSPQEELNAFLQDRTEHVKELIGPALDQGKIVILDRYFYSSIAHQGARAGNADEIRRLMESRFPVPDLVFILDADPAIGVHRIAHSRGEQPDHFENREDLVRVRAIFQSITGPSIHHLNADVPVADLHARILERFIEGPLKAKAQFQLAAKLRAQIAVRR